MISEPGILIGDVIADKYEVVDFIGQGGMGLVLEGVHRGLGQRVAIKLLRRDAKHDEELFARFEREARAAAQLRSRHAVRVYDVGTTENGTPFMVMEVLEGHDLDLELARHGRLEVRDAVSYVLQVCSAMAEAHALGIVHRDLKPHNLFLAQEGNDVVVKVLDFGISKTADEGSKSLTQTSSALGTPLYMSPEQIRSAKHVDARTDIWSLGVILYELIAGRPPFDADNPTAIIAAITADTPTPLGEVCPEVPKALSDAVMRALAKKPSERFADVASFAAAIAPFGDEGAFSLAARASLPSLRSRSEMSAPGFAATQRQDTHGSWETAVFRRPLKPISRVLLGVAAASLLAIAVAWGVTQRDATSANGGPLDVVPSAPDDRSSASVVATPLHTPSGGDEESPPAAEPSATSTPAGSSSSQRPSPPPARQPVANAPSATRPAPPPRPPDPPAPAPPPTPKKPPSRL